MAVKVLEIFAADEADRVVLMTGDTDLAPVVRAAKRMYSDREVCFAFPWNRKRDELAAIAKTCFTISREQYVKHQFPDPVIVGAKQIGKPPSW